MSDFNFFILLAMAFIALEIIAAFAVFDDREPSDAASSDG